MTDTREISLNVQVCPAVNVKAWCLYLGYTVSKTKETEHGMTAELKLAGSAVNAFGKDIHDLIIDVEYQTEHREFQTCQAQAIRP
jgi:hypothetical protein